ncbi:MAG: DUF1538 domain-containing protein [Clostridia bacterium]
MKILTQKFKEAFLSVMPITVIVLSLGGAFGIFEKGQIPTFLIGAGLLIVGMTLFTLGADVAMVEMGNRMGAKLTNTRKLAFIIFVCFSIGLIVTIAEPDLMVLGEQLSSAINPLTLIISVGIGVGLFLVISVLRIVFQISLRKLLLCSYALVFVLAIFVPKEFLSIAFDSGGVTTGAMTVPFIMAFGVGVAATKGGENHEDSFGLIALCSIGPILAVMILSFFSSHVSLTPEAFLPEVSVETSIALSFLSASIRYIKEVALALLPIVFFFIIFDIFALKLSKKNLIKIGFGLIYVFFGLVVFLTGVNVGFAPIGTLLGQQMALSNMKWLLVPVGMLIGFFIVVAEPAVHVLNEQVEEISGGSIKKSKMLFFMMCGVACAIGLAMLRVVTGISIWFILIPGYALAFILSAFVPKIYTAIAFDSGGVASGPMTVTFLLPLAIGASIAVGGNILTDAFGIVAMVAMVPLISIQLLGLLAELKMRSAVTEYATTMPTVVAGTALNARDLNVASALSVDEDIEDEIVVFDIPKRDVDNKNIEGQKTNVTVNNQSADVNDLTHMVDNEKLNCDNIDVEKNENIKLNSTSAKNEASNLSNFNKGESLESESQNGVLQNRSDVDKFDKETANKSGAVVINNDDLKLKINIETAKINDKNKASLDDEEIISSQVISDRLDSKDVGGKR